MRAVGIISEFNPFHNGHKHLIDKIRQELMPDYLVAVMSGNFVQRGEPAMWNKWTRAECAVENGVDLVLELPVCFAVNSAEEFARGGIRILKGLHLITDLAFGSESGEIKSLEAASRLLVKEENSFSSALRLALKEGISYPAAYDKAFRNTIGNAGEIQIDMLKGSNDILALEYLKQNIIQRAGLKPFAVKRIGCGHDKGRGDTEYASASAIRALIKSEQKLTSVLSALPSETYKVLESKEFFSKNDELRYFTLLRNNLLTKSGEELGEVLSVTEGLEKNLKQALKKAVSVDDMIMSVKSKRYTYAKISRILVQSLLGLNKNTYEMLQASESPYARVLGFNTAGAELLRVLKNKKSKIPILTNLNKNISDDDPRMAMLSLDVLASDLYSLIKGITIYDGSDFVNNPYISQSEQ